MAAGRTLHCEEALIDAARRAPLRPPRARTLTGWRGDSNNNEPFQCRYVGTQSSGNLRSMRLFIFVLAAAALAPVAAALVAPVASCRISSSTNRRSVMIIPPGNSDPNFDPDSVPEDAKRRTLVRSAIVWAVFGSAGALVASSGRTLSLDNAPGAAEQGAKKAASKKACELTPAAWHDHTAAEPLVRDRAARHLSPRPPVHRSGRPQVAGGEAQGGKGCALKLWLAAPPRVCTVQWSTVDRWALHRRPECGVHRARGSPRAAWLGVAPLFGSPFIP